MEMGYTVFTPHLNTSHFEVDCKCVWRDYIDVDLEFLRRSDIIFMLPCWEDSVGAKVELDFAKANNIPDYYDLEDL